MSTKCSQCDRPAIYTINDIPVCLSCAERMDQLQDADFKRHAVMHNRAAASLERTTGIPVPRIQIPDAGVRFNPVTMNNNVSIDRSVVGNVNTGTMNQLGASVATIRSENEQFGAQLQAVLDAVIDSTELAREQRTEVLELLATIAEDITAPQTHQRPTLRKSLVERVTRILEPFAQLASIWAAFTTNSGNGA